MTPSHAQSSSPVHRTLLAVGLGSLLFGAASGRALAAVTDDDDPPTTTPVREKIDQAALRSLTQANQEFAFDFYRTGITPGENLVMSPYGISECFALIYAGSDAETADRLRDLFHYPVPPKDVLASFGNLRKHIDGQGHDDTCRIDIASSCWAGNQTPVRPGYARNLESDLGGEIFSVDFSQARAVQEKMNAWVDENTNGLIKEAPGPVTPADILVLMNTVSLDATWKVEFQKIDTSDQPFSLADGSSIDVPTMIQEHRHRYLETDDAQIIELPYVGDEVSMTLVLPKEGRSLADLEKTLSSEVLAGWDRSMKGRNVKLRLPRFKLASSLDLKTLLGAMTSPGLFANLDLSRMLEVKSLVISDASQDAVIKVDEQGTEAAALTTVSVSRGIRPAARLVEMTVDRPFLYLVRDRSAGTIYFMGRVVDPRG